MPSRIALRVVGSVFALMTAIMVVRTGAFAFAPGPVTAGASDPEAMAYWYQLSFLRMFAVALAGLAAVAFWGSARLNSRQQVSLTRLFGGIAAAMALMALGQQWAVWNSTTGQLLAILLTATTVACLASGSRLTEFIPRRRLAPAAR
jgi:hypothetical protein